jgi:Zn-dependent protease
VASDAAETLVLGLAWYVVFLFSLTCHEAAHAWAAWRGGDPTAYHGGQVSLDPLPHVRREPFGTVVVPLLAYAIGGWMVGWASTPFDPAWARAHPRRAGWMSLAGPSANLLLALLAGGALRAGLAAGVFGAPQEFDFAHLAGSGDDLWAGAATLLSILLSLNLLLFVFNILPVPPLDGSGALAIFVSESGARRLQELLAQPPVALGGLLLAWFAVPHVFGPVLVLALRIVYAGGP